MASLVFGLEQCKHTCGVFGCCGKIDPFFNGAFERQILSFCFFNKTCFWKASFFEGRYLIISHVICDKAECFLVLTLCHISVSSCIQQTHNHKTQGESQACIFRYQSGPQQSGCSNKPATQTITSASCQQQPAQQGAKQPVWQGAKQPVWQGARQPAQQGARQPASRQQWPKAAVQSV